MIQFDAALKHHSHGSHNITASAVNCAGYKKKQIQNNNDKMQAPTLTAENKMVIVGIENIPHTYIQILIYTILTLTWQSNARVVRQNPRGTLNC